MQVTSIMAPPPMHSNLFNVPSEPGPTHVPPAQTPDEIYEVLRACHLSSHH